MYPGAQTGNGPMLSSNLPITQAPGQAIGHIHSELIEHDRLLLTLADEIGGLSDRLCGVLRPASPDTVANGNATPAPIKSPCADSLTDFNRRLQASINRVRDIAARADL